MFIGIEMLHFLLIKYFTVSKGEFLARVQIVYIRGLEL